MMEEVILVDPDDNPIGTMEKMKVHEEGKLHRAFSVFVINSQRKLLLQKRADSKYHSAGLWTNTCCSHPRPLESLEEAAKRRLMEEMGFVCSIEKVFHFTYKAKLENGLIEHEFDHVFIGLFNGTPVLNQLEVSEFKYSSLNEIEEELKLNPSSFTAWFVHCFKEVSIYIKNFKIN